jgi:iron complex outermembrane receptor protein
VSVTGTYTLPIDDSIGEISFGATLVHTSKQFLTIAVPAQFGNVKATDLVLLNASWKNIMQMPVDLSFFMTNATNEKYPLATTTAYNSFGGETQLPNEPRMWGFRLKYYFGQ